MPTEYTIHLKNLQNIKQKFWCFLSEPQADYKDTVFANSSAYLTVPLFTGSQDNYFTVPLQYVVQAGASNKVVGLKTKINSSVSEETDLGAAWGLEYFIDNEGPVLTKVQDVAPLTDVLIVTNDYDKNREQPNNWYNNITFGVRSENGFMGVTWSPQPQTKYMIRPKVEFYISNGTFTPGTLADISAISAASAKVTEADFDGNRECTVVLTSTGNWEVYKGNMNENNVLSKLIDSHLSLSAAHAQLVTQFNASGSMTTMIPAGKEPVTELLNNDIITH